jgi:DNA-binding CsgD family transcriptional regulator
MIPTAHPTDRPTPASPPPSLRQATPGKTPASPSQNDRHRQLGLTPLSPREQQVFDLRSLGLAYETIAFRLGCSIKAVTSYYDRALHKLNPTRPASATPKPAIAEPPCDRPLTFPRKSGHSRRVDNQGECSDDSKTTQDIYRRAKS